MREKKESIGFILRNCYPSNDYESIDKRHDLQIELKRLSVKDLELLCYKSVGTSHTEIAVRMKISRPTLLSRLSKIRKKILHLG